MKRCFRTFWSDTTSFGNLVFYLFLTLFAWLIGKVLLAQRLVICLVISYIVVIVVRSIYHKDRPKKEPYDGYFERIYASSFPSLHSMRAAVLIVLFGIEFSSWFAWLLFSAVAILILSSRYFLKKHHLSDIVAGFMIGLIISFVVVLVS